MNNYLFWFS